MNSNFATIKTCLITLMLGLLVQSSRGQSTAFSYSGQLSLNGAPANGYYDFIITLMAAHPLPDPGTGGVGAWSGMEPRSFLRVAVSNGAFTVTLDYGPAPFDGGDLLVGIQVRTNYPGDPMMNPEDPGPPYTELLPPQPIRTMPYAIRALNAGTAFTVTGPVPESSIPPGIPRLSAPSQTFPGSMRLPNAGNIVAGSFSGNGAELRNVRLGALDSGGLLSLQTAAFFPLTTNFIPAQFFQVADFNGDGKPDIANLGPSSTGIHTNNHAGGYAPHLNLGVSNEFVALDLNLDGFAEVLQGIRCHTNIAGQGFSPGDVGGGFDGGSLLAQLNADDDLDLVTAGGGTWLNYRDGYLLGWEIVDGQTNWLRTPAGFPLACSAPVTICGRPAVADVNGDGLPDVLARRCGSNALSVVTNRSAGLGCPWPASTDSVQVVSMPAGFYDFRAADFNGDGLADILAACATPYASNVVGSFTNYFVHVTLSLFLNEGMSDFALTWASLPLTNLVAFEVGDLNRDGVADVVTFQWAEASSPPEVPRLTGLRTFQADGGRGFSSGPFVDLAGSERPNVTPGKFALADADGDALPDVLIGGWGIALAAPPALTMHGGPAFAAASGPPFTVTSTSRVDRLNADLIDGLEAGSFVLKAGDTMTGPLAAPSFSGNGSALTGLSAANIATGTLPLSRGGTGATTPANARANIGAASIGGLNTFTGTNIFNNRVGIGTNAPVSELHVHGTVTADAFVGDGAGLSNLDATKLVGAISANNIAAGSVGAAQLSPGAALANLNAAGQSAVPSGALLLSTNAYDANLLAAGYVRLGSASLGEVWEPRQPLNAPAPRAAHVAVWTGQEMLVWGGSGSGAVYYSDGGRFNPALNTWNSLSSIGAPSARRAASAFWTGTDMIVWGGGNPGGGTNDGGRYNPTADSWLPMTTNGAPAVRGGHSAVWTGTELIVWGGSSGSVYFNDGARYNPATDTWAAMTTISGPVARSGHSAVWTGTEMIVWGGFDGTGYLADGRRYNPATDTWVPVSSVGRPAARFLHSAVWTGSQMLIWGGTGGGLFATGGIYDPAANAWDLSAIPTNAAPTARRNHVALWTGSEMLIWGGDNGSGLFNDGARFNPVTRSWSPLPLAGAPAPRSIATAVWAGSEMTVFGGAAAGTFSSETHSYTLPRTMFLYQRP